MKTKGNAKKGRTLKTKNGPFKVVKDSKMRWMGDTDLDKKIIRINPKMHKRDKKNAKKKRKNI